MAEHPWASERVPVGQEAARFDQWTAGIPARSCLSSARWIPLFQDFFQVDPEQVLQHYLTLSRHYSLSRHCLILLYLHLTVEPEQR